jgi:methionyl-tRNA formyltransferase
VKIIFAGTPQFAAEALKALIPNYEILAVLTQPDRPAGRGMQLTSSPVKLLAMQHGISVMQPASLKDVSAQEQIRQLNADVMVVAAYGLILPKVVLEIPRYGCLNIHASLLPRWRGAAPIQRAIQAGDAESGITIMQMDVGLDTGAMVLRSSCPITEFDSAQTLHDKLAQMGASCILAALERIPSGVVAVEQDDDLACYAEKLQKKEAAIDWFKNAKVIERTIRAFKPYPLCNFKYDKMVIKVWQASLQKMQGNPGEVLQVDKHGVIVGCGKDAIRLETLQKPGGKAQPVAQFIQACPVKVGDVLRIE